MSSRPYAQFSYSMPKSQHLASVQESIDHQYAQSYTNAQDGLIGTSPPFTTPSIAPTLGQTRRYKTQHTSIAPPTPNTNRQYSQNSLTLENPPPPSPSPSLASNQCLPTTNNNVAISSSMSSTLPASLPTPPTTQPSGLPCPNSGTTTFHFDLHQIIAQFGAQPELLNLILTSKVEEDKRKAEEAKLRVRELDLLLFERDRKRRCLEHARDVNESKNDEIHSNQDMDYDNENSNGTFSISDGSLNYASYNAALSSSPVQNLSLNSPGTPVSQSTPRLKSEPRLNSTPKAIQNGQEAIIGSAENDESNANNPTNKRKRKRREMLPVTMIIETKVHPYVDDYLWKNNGNTTQRKTGNKSVYYKCSNSNKGCPVNKTVTEKEGGWIIKYRGNHLDECGKIKRIVQS